MADVFLLDELNNEQRQAVTFDGPAALVIAGAGTGKTKVITSRIAHLVLNQKVAPESILALTFSEKAATEMSDRVEDLLPMGLTELPISTFHSFAHAVLSERGLDIGLGSVDIIRPPELSALLYEHQHLFELNYFKSRMAGSRFIDELLKHLSRAKEEDIDVLEYQSFANKLQAGAKTEEEKLEADRVTDLANAYQVVESLMQERGVMDYGDLIFKTILLFKNRPNVLKEYRRRFKYILVDEFQDTNYAQSKLLYMLTTPKTRLMVVGDDDQSIYKFRGASIANILTFKQKYPKAKAIVLNTNYRSKSEILNAAYNLITCNGADRLEATENVNKKLIAAKGDGGKVVYHHFDSDLDEVRWIAHDIVTRKKNKTVLGDHAILVRSHAHARLFTDVFTRNDIPFRYFGGGDLLMAPIVKDMVALLRVLHDFSNAPATYRMLSHAYFALAPVDIQQLLQQAKKAPYYGALVAYIRARSETSAPLTKVVTFLNDASDLAAKKHLSELLVWYLETVGDLADMAKDGSEESRQQAAVANDFLTIIKHFESERQPGDLSEVLGYVDALAKGGDMSSVVAAEPDAETVSIMTVHAAKGLEFPVVYIPSMVRGRFPQSFKGEALPLPAKLLEEPLPSERAAYVQEERRLAYVAFTRAEETLVLSDATNYGGGKRKWKPSAFLKEAKIAVSAAVKPPTGIKAPANKTKPPRAKQPLVIPKKFSATSLNTFERCPLQYRYRYVDRIPTKEVATLHVGVAVHNALYDFFMRVVNDDLPSVAQLHDMLAEHWISRGFDSKGAEKKRRQQAEASLAGFYHRHRGIFPKPAFLEQPFTWTLGAYKFTGRIDRIDELPPDASGRKRYHIIDYKTGRPKSEKDVAKDEQLALYTLVAQEVLGFNVDRATLYYVEYDQMITVRLKDAHLAKVRDKLLKTAEKVQQAAAAATFKPTSGFPCKTCDFRTICPSVAA